MSSITNASGEIEVVLWTADTIASFITTKATQNSTELLLLGLLIQGGASVTLPSNYSGVAYTP